MSLVHDDEVPPNLAQTWQDILALGQVERCDHLALLQPLVHAELIAYITPSEDEKLLIKLLLQLALPLKRKIRRADDEDAFSQTTKQ